MWGNELTDQTRWKLQAFPAYLRNAVKWYVASEFLSEESGKYQTQRKAEHELQRLQFQLPQTAYRRAIYK